LTEYANSLFQN